MNPYDILKVPRPARDEEIRQAYLRLIREHTPDREPEKFKAISNAYDQIKDAPSRMRHLIFHREVTEKTPFEVLTRYAEGMDRKELPIEKTFLQEYLMSCMKKNYSKK